MKTATFVRDLEGFSGDARLFRLSEPVGYDRDCDTWEFTKRTEFVVVSAAIVFGGPETYIFPANEDGEILNWAELGGSEQGILDHWEVLRNAGYEPA